MGIGTVRKAEAILRSDFSDLLLQVLLELQQRIDSCDTKFTGTSDFIKYARNSIFPLPPSIGERIILRHEKPFNNALSITLATAIW